MPESRIPHRDDPDVPDDDERLRALQAVLRRNGVGGAAPFTIEGEIEQMGHTAGGTRRRGWRRAVAWFLVVLVLGAFGLGVTVTLIDTIVRLTR